MGAVNAIADPGHDPVPAWRLLSRMTGDLAETNSDLHDAHRLLRSWTASEGEFLPKDPEVRAHGAGLIILRCAARLIAWSHLRDPAFMPDALRERADCLRERAADVVEALETCAGRPNMRRSAVDLALEFCREPDAPTRIGMSAAVSER